MEARGEGAGDESAGGKTTSGMGEEESGQPQVRKEEESVGEDASKIYEGMGEEKSGQSEVKREEEHLALTTCVRKRGEHAKERRECLTSRQILPIADLTPYEMGWTIKGRVTRKGALRSYRNARGAGHVFHIELIDEASTEIQVCMFDDAATMFFDVFKPGEIYYISRGKVHPANRKYSRVNNDYEVILNNNSFVEQSVEKDAGISGTCEPVENFVPIAELATHIGTRTLIDVIGIVRSVSCGTSIRRKSDGEEVSKREIIIEDESNKSVRVSLWGDLALKEGELLLKLVNEAPIIKLTAVRVTEFLGLSLSATNDTVMEINPETSAAKSLRSWYNDCGKNMTCIPIGVGLSHHHTITDAKPIYSNRAFLRDIILSDINSEKPTYFNVKASVSYIDPEQCLWYDACEMCTKKTSKQNDGPWCQACQRTVSTRKRYVVFARLADWTGEISVTAFNEEAEEILGQTADELCELRSQDTDGKMYRGQLRKATWIPKLFRLAVIEALYMNQKRRRATIREVLPVDWTGECRLLLKQIETLKTKGTPVEKDHEKVDCNAISKSTD